MQDLNNSKFLTTKTRSRDENKKFMKNKIDSKSGRRSSTALPKLAALILTLLTLLALPAMADQRGDEFNVPRTFVLSPAQDIVTASAQVTNNPVLVRMLDGYAAVNIFAYTNAGASGGTMTFTLQGSVDTTNWFNIGSFALISGATTFLYTNTFYSTNLIATNSVLLPGTYTYPSPSGQGYVGPYLASLPYTNSGAVTISSAAGFAGFEQMGFSIGDAPPYLRGIWTPGGTVTNWTVGATVTAIPIGTLK